MSCSASAFQRKIRRSGLQSTQKKKAKVYAPHTPQQPTRRETGTSTATINKRLFDTPGRSAAATKVACSPKKYTNEESHLRVATGIYAAGVPFRYVENTHFQAMFDFKLPSRHQLAGRQLDSVFKRESQRVIKSLASAKYLAVVTDGWTNPNSESIINFVLTNPHVKPVFWESVSTRGAAHTAEFVAQSISAVIDEVEAAVRPGIVTAVVTDNAANMVAALSILQQTRCLICCGCSSHGMNLLMKDIFEIEGCSLALKKAAMLAKFVKSRSALKDRFCELQRQMKME